MKKIKLKNSDYVIYLVKKDCDLKHINIILSDCSCEYERMILEINYSYSMAINPTTHKRELLLSGFNFIPMSSYCVELHSTYMRIIERGLIENWKETYNA